MSRRSRGAGPNSVCSSPIRTKPAEALNSAAWWFAVTSIQATPSRGGLDNSIEHQSGGHSLAHGIGIDEQVLKF